MRAPWRFVNRQRRFRLSKSLLKLLTEGHENKTAAAGDQHSFGGISSSFNSFQIAP